MSASTTPNSLRGVGQQRAPGLKRKKNGWAQLRVGSVNDSSRVVKDKGLPTSSSSSTSPRDEPAVVASASAAAASPITTAAQPKASYSLMLRQNLAPATTAKVAAIDAPPPARRSKAAARREATTAAAALAHVDWQHLPVEILSQILAFLPLRTYPVFARTCRYWSEVVRADTELVARSLYAAHWQANSRDHLEGDWKRQYCTRFFIGRRLSAVQDYLRDASLPCSPGGRRELVLLMGDLCRLIGRIYESGDAPPFRTCLIAATVETCDNLDGAFIGALCKSFCLEFGDAEAHMSLGDYRVSVDEDKLLRRLRQNTRDVEVVSSDRTGGSCFAFGNGARLTVTSHRPRDALLRISDGVRELLISLRLTSRAYSKDRPLQREFKLPQYAHSEREVAYLRSIAMSALGQGDAGEFRPF